MYIHDFLKNNFEKKIFFTKKNVFVVETWVENLGGMYREIIDLIYCPIISPPLLFEEPFYVTIYSFYLKIGRVTAKDMGTK